MSILFTYVKHIHCYLVHLMRKKIWIYRFTSETFFLVWAFPVTTLFADQLVCVCACVCTRRLGRQIPPDLCSSTTLADHSRPVTTSTSGCLRASMSKYKVLFYGRRLQIKAIFFVLLWHPRLIDYTTRSLRHLCAHRSRGHWCKEVFQEEIKHI